ncbi:FAD-dependent oxidoreductase [Burkholderia sp. WAC0059]|uniref:FAD-dependent oxidoreductase n=1 Tax=Burkholderia sp. WAC0059 TaxID=2066022 RepID=UPI0015E09EE8|nr:GMC family oxidoreductase [Burkholderia sp. WAC0059]
MAASRTEDVFDFLVIGTGAGGSASAFELARAGHRVLMLEKGDELPADGSTYDATLVVAGKFNSKEPWKDRNGGVFMPEEHFNVGGKTRWYGAALLRPDEAEFGADARLSMPGWPLEYAEMTPYFERAERLLEVRTFDAEPDLARMAPAFGRHGWQSRPMPLGISNAIHQDPVQETHWDGYALPDTWKSEARFHLLDPILTLPNVALVKNAEVDSLLPGATPAQIVGVRCKDGREFRASTVLLAAGALHSPRLLQRYFDAVGLAGRLPASASVGRNFKRHILSAVIGFGVRRKQDRLCKTQLWTSDAFAHSSVQPLGGWADVETVRYVLRAWPKFVRDLFALHSYGFFLQTEDSSIAENRVIAEPPGGLPTLDYAVDRMPELRDEHEAMCRSFRRALRTAGLLNFRQSIPLSGLAHCAGTLAAGADPATSVVDAEGRVHGMENLYVVDGSVLPRLSKMNPSLTIYAWGLRIGERLSRAYGKNPQQ